MDRPIQTFDSVAAMLDYLRTRLDDSDDLLIRVPDQAACDVRCGVNHFRLSREQLEALLKDSVLGQTRPTFSVIAANVEATHVTPEITPEITLEAWDKQRLATEKDYPLQEPFYSRVRDHLNAGERLPFPELPEEVTAMIYALIDHCSFYSGFWGASMERLLAVPLAASPPIAGVAPSSQPATQKCPDDSPHEIRRYPPRLPRDVMRRRNRLVTDADGRRVVKIERHKHETPDRLELQIEVLKENQTRWPGEIDLPSNADQIRRGAAVQFTIQGVTKFFLIVPDENVRSKGHLQILIEALEETAVRWRKLIQRGSTA